MLEFRLKPPSVWPAGRQPRLNRQHPLFHNQHIVSACVPRGKGIIDLVTGQFAGGSTTLVGQDASGPYIWSNDTAGTAACSIATGSTPTISFFTIGCIFKVLNTAGRSYPWTFANTGFFLVGGTMTTVINNGNWFSFVPVLGHTYLGFWNNSVGTASLTKTVFYMDLDTGQIIMGTAASTGNVTMPTAVALQAYSTYLSTIRFYAGFITGSVLVPPAVQPSATFYSIDQFMGGIADPWSLFYA